MWLKFLPIIGALIIGWLLITFFGNTPKQSYGDMSDSERQRKEQFLLNCSAHQSIRVCEQNYRAIIIK